MEEVIVSCSGGKHVGKDIAKNLKIKYSELSTEKFPDEELNIKFKTEIKNKKVILIQSFYDNLNEKIIETLFAYYTAKDLGAKKIELISPYFPYFRQDKRFEKGQGVSIKIISKLFKIFDKIYFIDPHLHRIKKLKQVFKNGKKLDATPLISEYVKNKKIKNPLFIGPDVESGQWAKKAADIINEKSAILKKKRYSDRKVEIKLDKKINVEGKNLILVDDIISTGHTMLETIKKIKKMKPKKIYCIAIHGVFADKKTLNELKKHSEVICTNTIPNKEGKIDISNLFKK